MTVLPPAITDAASYKTLTAAKSEAAAIAGASQAAFRTAKRRLLISGAIASICGGLLLYSAELDPNVQHLLKHLRVDPYKTGLVLVQAVLLGAVAYYAFLLTNQGFVDRWRDHRLRAEKLRLQIEEEALKLGHAAGQDAFRAAKEGFLAFVEGQRKHLTNRQSKARRSHATVARYGAAIAALIALTGALSGLENALVVALIGLIGVAAPAAATAVQSWTEATAEAKRERLHGQTAEALVDVMVGSARFSEAIEAHNLPGALAFAEEVFAVLRKDHQAFADLYSD